MLKIEKDLLMLANGKWLIMDTNKGKMLDFMFDEENDYLWDMLKRQRDW